MQKKVNFSVNEYIEDILHSNAMTFWYNFKPNLTLPNAYRGLLYFTAEELVQLYCMTYSYSTFSAYISHSLRSLISNVSFRTHHQLLIITDLFIFSVRREFRVIVWRQPTQERREKTAKAKRTWSSKSPKAVSRPHETWCKENVAHL